jgi:uncharacterized protein involved in exopolysaccharide biosynthesis
VAKDLGTWPPEQATVLVQVLQRARLNPAARRTKEGIVITVPDEEGAVAMREMSDNMEAIADAARSRSEARRRRSREQQGRARGATGGAERPTLTSEKLLGAAKPLVILLVSLLVLSTVARVSPVLALVGVGVGVYLLGKRTQDGQGGPSRSR